MTELLVVIVSALAVIAAATVVGPRLGIASPLVLVAIGVGASFLPVFGSVHIEAEWVLEGVLPPLLYSSAVAMPAMNFRREFGAIGGLSVLLVVASALVLGVFFMLVVPGLGFAWGVALGAIVSPTDAVATSIIKQMAVSKRVVALLDGESLLNDATALVVLGTATAASFSFFAASGTFVYSVVVATVIGWAVGRLNLMIRKPVTDATVNTVISFTVPFVASIPATALGASGLVAAVVAGIVTGVRAPRDLSARNRLSDSQNWRTVELVLEGAVFLTMGVQIKGIVTDVRDDHGGVGTAVLIAAGALVLTVLVRAAYVGPLLGVLAWRSRVSLSHQPRIREFQEKLSTPEGKRETLDRMSSRGRQVSERDLEHFHLRIVRGIATTEYFLREPLGPREGVVVVWAGMRGAVTVAAAQTLKEGATPHRSVLVLIAFGVAAMSLLVQGGTIGPLLRLIASRAAEPAAEPPEDEQARIFELMRVATDAIPRPPETDQDRMASRSYRLDVLAAQRAALLDARDNGTFDAEVLERALANLDASQIAIEMRG
ncbi:cation:proton antiporter [Actinoplanes sp. HUAS TT8]|uniref:cation:proton antiporter n=1 Tax=Actinoplanes sp. HUAS TT8 TaxID=3447453 RepID=UPI003F51F7B7